MAYCFKCGKELSEGAAFCHNCGEKCDSFPDSAVPVSVTKTDTQHKSNGFIYLIISVLVVIIIVVIKKPSQSKNTTTYSNEDKLIKAYAEAFTNADAEKLLHTIYPMAVYNKIDQTRIKAIADDMVFINAIFKSTANSDPDYSMEIISRLNLDKDSIHDIEYYYSYNEGTQIAVKDGKYLTVRMEAFGERDTIYLTVFEIDGEGWKITPQSALYILGRG